MVWALAGSLVTLAGTAAVIGWVPAGRIGLALTATQLAMGVSGGLIISPNQALTLATAFAALDVRLTVSPAAPSVASRSAGAESR